jgi:phage terminase small subunit
MKRNPYTFRQTADHARLRAFARAFVMNGGNAAAAAEEAGFARKSAPSIMAKEQMPGLIATAMRSRLAEITPELVQVLLGIALNEENSTKDRVNAANSLLDRGPHSRKQETETTHVISDPARLIAEVWERRQARLAGPDAPQVIDAEAEPVDAS